ncbi:hypothetical protein [Streptomyces kronopolitis]|uniref:hypothetical protein n=1 Tax=Streptomyces kronopolitis TaxID=1612435 RepID=UPI00343B31C8
MPERQLTPDQITDLGEAAGKIAAFAAKALHREYPHLDLEGLVGAFTRDSALEMIALRYLDGIELGMSPGDAAGEAGKALIRAWADARLAARAQLARERADHEAVFGAAQRSTSWKHNSLGAVTEVTHAGHTWTVNLPPAQLDDYGREAPVRARIIGRFGYGGSEVLNVDATWGQTVGLVDAVMAARRV